MLIGPPTQPHFASIMGLLNRLFGPSEDKFAKLLLHRLKQVIPDCDLVYNRQAFQLCPAGENGLIINLANLYAEYRAASGSERRELVDHCLATFVSAHNAEAISEDFAEVKAGIMPSVRSRAYFELVRLSAELELNGVPPTLPIYQPINDHLVCGFVYDSGPSMRFLHHEDLATWGTTVYEIMELAKMNFEQKPPMGFSKIGDSFYSVIGDADYGATRLLHDDLLAKMEVAGDMVAAVPNRGILMVTGTECVEGLKIMADLLAKEAEEPRPITSMLFRRDGEDWQPWLPPKGHPTYAAFKLAAVKSIASEYHDQHDLLEKRCSAQGDDTFVGSFSAMEHEPTGEVMSYCVWPEGVRALLPKTDLIGLVENNKEVTGMVPWHDVEQVAGDLLDPQGLYPERFRVEAFPSPNQLLALRSKAS